MELNGTIFVQIFIFLILLFWLSRFLFAPILRLFDERERRIDGAKKQAEELHLIALDKSRHFDAEYAKAKDAARATLAELKLSMEREYQDAIERSKKVAKDKLLLAEKELLLEEQKIKSQLHEATHVLAGEIVAKFLPKTVIKESHHEYV